MLVYIIRRLMQAALVMVVMSAVVFAGIYVIGDPVAMMISPDASEVERDAVRVTLGLDQPMWRQYLTFVGDALHGDFGKSFLAGQPAMGLIFERMPATMELAVASLILSLMILLPMDYVNFARAKGLSENRIVGVHVLKNIMIPIATVSGLEFGQTVAFAVVTETVFSWPGMGKLLIDSILLLDRPVVVAYLVVIVFFFVILNLVVDLLYSVLDP